MFSPTRQYENHSTTDYKPVQLGRPLFHTRFTGSSPTDAATVNHRSPQHPYSSQAATVFKGNGSRT